jgi:hypothetical protein
MGGRRRVLLAACALYVVVAIVVFFVLIPVHSVQRSRLSALVPSHPPAGFNNKPASSTQVAASNSPFPEVKAAAKSSPNSTGSYSIEWTKASPSNDAVSLIASMLPSTKDASTVQSQAKSNYLGQQSLKSASYNYVAPVAVPGIPGASAALFSSSTGNPPLVVVAFQKGRAQVTAFVGVAGQTIAGESTARSVASSEYRLLNKVLPGFTLTRTSWPLVASIVYWLVAAAVIAAAVLVPWARRRVIERRRLSAEVARTRAVGARGSKIARRQAARRK